jgi:cyclophilin family peptidyl-prolyl cis-trans isomerase
VDVPEAGDRVSAAAVFQAAASAAAAAGAGNNQLIIFYICMNRNTYVFPGILPDDRIKNKKAVITTKKGIIEFEFLTSEAPKTVSNFVYLTELGYYNGLTFHRVEPGFVVQGGDPNGDGRGGPGYRFEDEPVVRAYDQGIVAMANAGPNTNGSQFFIMLADNSTLPKNYTIFGKVVKGMDVVLRISADDVMKSVIVENI